MTSVVAEIEAWIESIWHETIGRHQPATVQPAIAMPPGTATTMPTPTPTPAATTATVTPQTATTIAEQTETYGLPSSIVVKFSDGTNATATLVEPTLAASYFGGGQGSPIAGLQALYDAGPNQNKTISGVYNNSGQQFQRYGTSVGTATQTVTDFPIGELYITPDNARYSQAFSPTYLIATTPAVAAPVPTPSTVSATAANTGVWYFVNDGQGNQFQTQSKTTAYNWVSIYGGEVITQTGETPGIPVK